TPRNYHHSSRPTLSTTGRGLTPARGGAFRARATVSGGAWLVRRVRQWHPDHDVLLHAYNSSTPFPLDDTDASIGPLWVAAVFPEALEVVAPLVPLIERRTS